MYWYEKEVKTFSPILSTRVRFARNMEGIPFPHRMSDEAKKELWKKVCEVYVPHGGKPVSFCSEYDCQLFFRMELWNVNADRIIT